MTATEAKDLIAIAALPLGIAIFVAGMFVNEGYNFCAVPGFLLMLTSAIILIT